MNYKFALLTLLTALLSVTGCAPKAPNPLRIGMNPWPGYEFLYLAEVKGYYKEEGVDVRLEHFNALADALHAYERGQLDGLGCTMVELTLARVESARQPQAVYVSDYSEGADQVLARSEIKTVADLKGKRVGLEIDAVGIYMLARTLDSAQLTIKDVQMVATDQLSGEAALAAGSIDSLVTYPPFSVRLLNSPNIKSIYNSSQIKGEIVDMIIVDSQEIKSRPEDVKKLVRAFRKAQEFARTHPDEAYAIMAQHEGLTSEEFKDAITSGIHIPTIAEQKELMAPNGPLIKTLRNTERVLQQAGQINSSSTPETAINILAL